MTCYFSQDPQALQGGVGEKSVRRILDHALKVAPDLGRALLTQLCSQIRRLDAEAD